MKEIQKLEVGADIGIDTRQQTLAGVAFPLTKQATEALLGFGKGKCQYVQLKIGNFLTLHQSLEIFYIDSKL